MGDKPYQWPQRKTRQYPSDQPAAKLAYNQARRTRLALAGLCAICGEEQRVRRLTYCQKCRVIHSLKYRSVWKRKP